MARRQCGQLDAPAGEKSVPSDDKASDRSRTSAANAESISPLVLALKNWTCSPSARATASRLGERGDVFAGLAGLISTQPERPWAPVRARGPYAL